MTSTPQTRRPCSRVNSSAIAPMAIAGASCFRQFRWPSGEIIIMPELLLELDELEFELEEELDEFDAEPEDVEELDVEPDELAEGIPVPPHPKKAVVNSRTDSISIVFIPITFLMMEFLGRR